MTPLPATMPGSALFPEASRKEFLLFENLLRVLLASLLVSIAAAQIVAAILVVVWVDLMVRGRMRYRRTLLDIPILVYVGVRILAVIFSEFTQISTLALTREIVFYITFFYCSFYFQHAGREGVIRTIQVLIVSTLLVTVVSCFRYLMGWADRANGLTGGGTLATHLSMMTSLLLIRGREREILPGKFTLWIALLILMAGMLCSLFRGDTIAVTLVILIYSIRFNPKLVGGVAVFALVILLLIPPVRAKFQTLSDPVNHSSDRLTLWNNGLKHASAHPILGYGPETFPVVFDDVEHLVDKRVGGWHNDNVQVYIESGILGLASWYVIVVMFAIASIRLIRKGPGNPHYETGWIGILMILAYIISGSFGTPTFSITNAILFRFLLAMVVAGTMVPLKGRESA
jgi:O-antigen ligase